MKVGRTIALVVLLTWVAVYLMVSFVTWQIDASQWQEETRFMCAFLFVLLSPFAAMVGHDLSLTKDKK
jgi:hypothetical protein